MSRRAIVQPADEAERRRAEQHGLYRAATEHDSCGVGFVADLGGRPSHQIVEQGLAVLRNLAHRGATGADPLTGDGSGVMIRVPHELLARECDALGFALPAVGEYGVGNLFLPTDPEARASCVALAERIVRDEGQRPLGWRDVPIDDAACGPIARSRLPVIRQIFVGRGDDVNDRDALERKLYVIRKRLGRTVRDLDLAGREPFYVCTLSSRTMVYKGMLLPEQLPRFFPDLVDEELRSPFALVHQRFSTNTFPSWQRSHPYRLIAHNGEINTIRGNVNWMHARQRMLSSPLFGDDLAKLLPIVDTTGSDSAMFDNVLELLLHTGRSLPHAMMMMVPEAWQKDESMSDAVRAFYEYHSCMLEPWDGPASIAFCDGRVIGAMLDRNGLRPSRYVVTTDGLVVMASEAGVLDIPVEKITLKNRVQPGRMFLVNLEEGRLVDDLELKEQMAARRHYRAWLRQNLVSISDLPPPGADRLPTPPSPAVLRARQRTHGYTLEELRMLLAPMALNGQETVGSMGNDTPLAVLSDRPQLLFHYFKQLFAQVTNPPIDPIREDLVMSIETSLGPEQNLFDESPLHCHQLHLDAPVISTRQLQQVKDLATGRLRSSVLPTLFRVADGGPGLRAALDHLCAWASAALAGGSSILLLSDRGHNDEWAPIPSLLATSTVHHHLIREGTRTRCGIVVETGEAREVMHFCLLVGYGAGAVNPYVACDSIADLVTGGALSHIDAQTAVANYLKAANKGVLKVMSKMGISTLQSYHGAQVFEALGLHREIVERHFAGTSSRIEGIGLDGIARECAERHRRANPVLPVLGDELDAGGQYQWRRRGEHHMYNPETIASLQHAVRSGSYRAFKRYTEIANDESQRLCTIRGLLDFKRREPVPLDEVEPAHEIVKRFKTGAMSLGSISREAHETLAIAMNRLGAKSNTGEGGEDPARWIAEPGRDSRNSAIKQVASGRFGVTIQYLANAVELQIKMAQGAKPGEGGQLPGHKVDEYIADIRCSTPGVGLISPPPHHDIYSIEDLAQLIYDLKCANPAARIGVKLVSEVGVGTIAAGVAKAKADVILISGDSGGTGAAPLGSIKHAGVPWELGLAEAQQVLVLNRLRGRVRLEADGQLKTGRDIAVACLLGAEEFGFATAALVASGCVMMRVCHLNTCPVGIATQDPRLRARFAGEPAHVVNLMTFLAEDLREVMAQLGFRTVEEMVGRVDALEPRTALDHWKARGVDLSAVLHAPERDPDEPIHHTEEQDHGIALALDRRLIELCRPALEQRESVSVSLPVRNVDRAVGTMLSGEVAKRFGQSSLPDRTIRVHLTGSAGQSFGAFLAAGVQLSLDGEANDYFGKGLSGGRIVVRPPAGATFVAEDNIIVGNVGLYGATSGEVFLRGLAGERFAVRNSGAVAVVEGVGDHGCEYMTRGTVLVLGPVGRNFAAGMSGGVAYVLDLQGRLDRCTNLSMVELDPLDDEDLSLVKTLLHRHYELTSSAVAWRALSGWREHARRFVKVMPVEYRRVLASQHLLGEASRLASV